MLLNTKLYPSSLPKLCLLVIVLTLSSSPTTSQTCKNACGSIPIKYPFGTGPGCGDPRFHTRVTCTNQQLTFATHTGCYPITSIDYATQVLHLIDPTMSTCACTQPSNGFGLDLDAPFSFHDDTVFALLDCSSNATVSPAACDSQTGARVCGLLGSCRAGAASRMEVPVPESTCCAYVPVDLGPAFEMDLRRLKCGGYSGMYGFSGHVDDPGSWTYGMGIKYKFNFNNEYPPTCGECERSKGVCGYNVGDESLLCNCASGFNTTEDCSFEATWNRSSRFLPWHTGDLWMCGLAWVLIWMMV